MAETNSEITCTNCGTVLGYFILVEDVEFLQAGGILAREIHGVCAQCGKEIHWSVLDRKLELLLKRVLGAEKE